MLSTILLGADSLSFKIPPPKQSYTQRVVFLLIFSLKLGNLFLNDNMEIKLGDFGLATRLEYDG